MIVGVPSNVHHVITVNACRQVSMFFAKSPWRSTSLRGEDGGGRGPADSGGKPVNTCATKCRPCGVVDRDELARSICEGHDDPPGNPGWGSWFTRKEESGGGPLIDIGVHALDVAWFLIGNPKPISVNGHTYTAFESRTSWFGQLGHPDWSGTYNVGSGDRRSVLITVRS